jgi:hypothetical protein
MIIGQYLTENDNATCENENDESERERALVMCCSKVAEERAK